MVTSLAIAASLLRPALSDAGGVSPRREPASERSAIRAALAWAKHQLGDVYTRQNPYAAWWSGYCEAFVEDAYGRRFRYWSAALDYKAARRRHRLHRGVPPRGALVFYSGMFGHVALSAGHGWVISTVGDSENRFPVRRVRYRWFAARYLGWAMPSIAAAHPRQQPEGASRAPSPAPTAGGPVGNVGQ